MGCAYHIGLTYSRRVLVRGIRVPDFMYGTAWKEDRTEDLVVRALANGFRAIDTANQRKHYVEADVGAGIGRAGVPRDELFVQTKFTHVDGQDARLPYDRGAPVEQQVAQSYASSIEHLRTERIDCLVMHGPTQRIGLGPDDHGAWRGMEALADRVPLLGVSNVNAGQLEDLVAFARVPPAFVQNRCYANRGWDADVRAACARHGIVYQGFSLLTANRDLQYHRGVKAIVQRRGVSHAQLIFAFARQRGMLPLTGTSSPIHMREDLASLAIELAPDELDTLETAGAA
jgi:diketogulonate reductase-like aldo/keto reductase